MSDWLLLPEHLQRLWFVHAVARSRSLLNIGADVVIKGPCSAEELQAAFTAAVDEHDAFRLRFRLGKSGPECQPLDAPLIQWRVVGLGDHVAPVSDGVHWQIAEGERQPFCPEDGSMVRATLYLLGRELAVLAITAHHLVADAWTIRVLVQDILSHWRRIRGDTIAVTSEPDRFLEYLAQHPGGTAERNSTCSGLPSLQLPLDRRVLPEDRSGTGGEVAVQLDKAIYHSFSRQCAGIGQTSFAGLAGALLVQLAQICRTSTVEAGILVTTRHLRRQHRTAGCFVQAVPVRVHMAPDATTLQVVQDVGLQIREVRAQARRGPLPLGLRSPVMVSMVRDSSARLIAPTGLHVCYERRRRTQAECDLHVFIYDRTGDVEVVFNYDSDVLSAATVTSWADNYIKLIERISEASRVSVGDIGGEASGAVVGTSSRAFSCRLQHVGLAAWELDIGLRRLASAGITIQGQSWDDHETGVTMALAGPPGGLQLEVVAPLREEAPCVGALIRDGEGPYHYCWRVFDTDADGVLAAMRRLYVSHTLIRRNGHSGLFPRESITFLFVEGFGLVEFLHGAPDDENTTGQHPVGSVVHIDIGSTDQLNARRFLHAMGLRPSMPTTAPNMHDIWVQHESGCTFHLLPAEHMRPSSLAWTTPSQLIQPTTAICPNMHTTSEAHMHSTWSSRLHFLPTATDVRSAPDLQP